MNAQRAELVDVMLRSQHPKDDVPGASHIAISIEWICELALGRAFMHAEHGPYSFLYDRDASLIRPDAESHFAALARRIAQTETRIIAIGETDGVLLRLPFTDAFSQLAVAPPFGPGPLPQPMAFMGYNSKDRALALLVANALHARGISVWIDCRHLRPGEPFQRALESVLTSVGAAVLIVGPHGLGPWQGLEVQSLIDQFTRRAIRVIPTVLPGGPRLSELPQFLSIFSGVEFARVPDDAVALGLLEFAITGLAPRAR